MFRDLLQLGKTGFRGSRFRVQGLGFSLRDLLRLGITGSIHAF